MEYQHSVSFKRFWQFYATKWLIFAGPVTYYYYLSLCGWIKEATGLISTQLISRTPCPKTLQFTIHVSGDYNGRSSDI